jgi:Tfp pilus assembly protein PilF
MSLLADLLSKYKAGSSQGGSEKQPGRGIPPTLFKGSGIPASVRRLDKRYVLISVICLVVVTIGYFVAANFDKLNPSAKKNPPTPAKTANKLPATAPVQPQITLTPPVVTVPLEQTKNARITLEEPVASSPLKKKIRHRKEAAPHPIALQVKPVRPQPAAALSQQKAIPQPVIDTAARDSHLYTARSAELVRDWRTALSSYRMAHKIDPNNYVIMNNTAAALNNLGMFADGAQEAELALAKKPDYVPALINAAISYSSMGNTNKAVRLFSTASALDPGNRSLVINLGILHERAGNLDDAQATYRQLAESGDPLALQGMARVYERKGNLLEAVRAYRQIMGLTNATPELKQEVKRMLVKLDR